MKEKIKALLSRLKQKWNSLGNYRWLVGGFILSLSIVLGVSAYAWVVGNRPTLGDTIDDLISLQVELPEPPQNKELPLDGALVTEAEYDRIMKYLPMAVMIENLVGVRPVSGLSKADLVFEALVEGGITRYMAVFLHHDVDEIMPVRSARSYYLDWLGPLDATYMHIGGAVSDNPRVTALPRIFNEGVKTYVNINGTWLRKPGVFAPHNAFTSTSRMKDAQDKKGWARSSTVKAWLFKDDELEQKRPAGEQAITLEWSLFGKNGYEVKWVYDHIGNRYFYEVAGSRQVDPATSQDVTARNIIIQLTNMSSANDQQGRIVYDTIGEGNAIIFRDGIAINATWKKLDVSTRTVYFDAEGREVEFNRGTTWVQIAPTDSVVTY